MCAIVNFFPILVDAEQILADIKMAEIAVNFSLDVSKTAEKSSAKAKQIGEEALKNITSLVKVSVHHQLLKSAYSCSVLWDPHPFTSYARFALLYPTTYRQSFLIPCVIN